MTSALSPPEGRVKPGRLDALLVVAVGALAYSNTFRVPFTFDDVGEIVASHPVRDLPTALRELPLAPRAFGRLSFALDYAVHGLDVTGYHVVNLVIHLLTALVVCALARTLLRAAGAPDDGRMRLAGLAAALLFVAHPIQTQAVTYVVQRYASLATLLYGTALLLYARSGLEEHRGRSRAQYAGAIVAAFLAMRVKEIALTLPLALGLYEVLFVRAPARERLRRLAAPLLLLAVIPSLHFLAYAPAEGPATLGTVQAVSRGASEATRLEYLLTQARVIMTYLRLLVLPVGQNIDYDYPLSRSVDVTVAVSALGIAASIGAGAWLARVGRSRPSPAALVAGFGILFFFLALSVESSVIPIREVIAEHRMYLPAVGAAVAAGVAAAAGTAGFRARLPRLSPAPGLALGALVLALGTATWSRNAVWRDPVALWSDAATKSPAKLRPILNWAGALRNQGDREAALRVSLRGLALQPTDSEELLALGNVYRELGDAQNARRLFEESLRLRPYFGHTLMALGTLSWEEGDRAGARQYFQRAVDANPVLSGAHLKLAIALYETGERDRAYDEFELYVRYAAPWEAENVARITQLLRERRPR